MFGRLFDFCTIPVFRRFFPKRGIQSNKNNDACQGRIEGPFLNNYSNIEKMELNDRNCNEGRENVIYKHASRQKEGAVNIVESGDFNICERQRHKADSHIDHMATING